MTTDLTGDAASHVTTALADGQRERIIDRFCAVNPHWRGANADDILTILDDSDCHLDETEPWWEWHGQEVTARGWSPRLVNLALLALIRADSPADRWKAPTFEAVAELVGVVIERVKGGPVSPDHLQALLRDLASFDPIHLDEFNGRLNLWRCVLCDQVADTADTVTHAPTCLWVRAQGVAPGARFRPPTQSGVHHA